MSKLLRATVLLLGATLPLAAAAAPAVPAPVMIAAGRCNSQTIDDASSHLRDYDRHAPGGNPAQLTERYGAIADVIATLNEERDVLNSICSTDAQRAFFAQIAANAAWALALEADVAPSTRRFLRYRRAPPRSAWRCRRGRRPRLIGAIRCTPRRKRQLQPAPRRAQVQHRRAQDRNRRRFLRTVRK
jgi:hypothetical protein